MPGTGCRLLIVEDQELMAMTLTTVVRMLNFTLVGSAPTAQRALQLMHECHPDVVLLDFHLKGQWDGAEAARAIRDASAARIVFLTGSSDPAEVKRMQDVKPDAIVFKPFRRTELAEALTLAAKLAGSDVPAMAAAPSTPDLSPNLGVLR